MNSGTASSDGSCFIKTSSADLMFYSATESCMKEDDFVGKPRFLSEDLRADDGLKSDLMLYTSLKLLF